MDQANINFALYEDGKEFLGMVSVDLPEISWLTQTINGAGIGGNLEAVILAHVDAMTTTFHYRTVTKEALKLNEPRRHNIDLRVAQQIENPITGLLETHSIKHAMVVIPKTYSPGNVAPASTGDGSGAFAVHRWETFVDGVSTQCIDPINMECKIDGVDYMAPVRQALGK